MSINYSYMYTLTNIQPTFIQPSPTSSNPNPFEDCWIDFLDHGLLARKLKGVKPSGPGRSWLEWLEGEG